jgi:ribosome-associated protein
MADRWRVPEDEVVFRFVASGGPGGQHANRSNTKVDAVFRVGESPSMPRGLQARVRAKLGDVVRVTVDDERSQLRNRQLALERIRERIDAAGRVERPRRATKPTRGSQRRRLDSKRRRGDVKRQRKRPGYDD